MTNKSLEKHLTRNAPNYLKKGQRKEQQTHSGAKKITDNNMMKFQELSSTKNIESW